jgi:phage-related protein
MFEIIYCNEAIEQMSNLDRASYKKLLKDVEKFKSLGIGAVDTKNLTIGLWEMRTDNIRTYYAYEKDRIIIVGLVVLKKSQKAPKRYIEQAINNINKVKWELKNNKE